MNGNIRRRSSAFIDFLWTSTSAASICVALLAFGDLVWKAYEQQSESALRSSFDQLLKLDGMQLIALNCLGGKPVADAELKTADPVTATDAPCRGASRIAHWRRQSDEHTAEVLKICPKDDVQYLTRSFSVLQPVNIVASCIPSEGDSPCMQARCRQERDVANILFDVSMLGDKLRADATLDSYRKTWEDAASVPLHEIHSSTHPFPRVAFFAFLPLWAAIFGVRLARAAAEFLDPAGAGKGFRSSLRSTWSETAIWLQILWIKQRRQAGLIWKRLRPK